MKILWTPTELTLLEQNLHLGPKQLHEQFFPHRTYNAIRSASSNLQQNATREWTSWTENDTQRLKDHWATTPMKDILAMFPTRTYSALKTKARNCGVQRPKHRRIGTLSPLLADTPESYYWFGFLTADGSISKNGQLRLALSLKDESHLLRLASLLQANPIYQPKTNSVIIGVSEKALLGYLSQRGLTQRKTYNPPDLGWWLQSEEKFTPFFAGFIDGDGTITKTYNTITIVIHRNWANNLEKLQEAAHKYWDIYSSSLFPVAPDGYARLRIRIHSTVKDRLKTLGVPVLHRKWDRIT